MSIQPRIALASVIMLGLVLFGCAKPPEAEIANAKNALAAAQDAAAATWAADEWQQAQDAMTAVDQEVAAQASKFALTRSYDHTNELLTAANQKAEAAKTAAVANKEAARQAASQALESMNSALANAQMLSEHIAGCKGKPKGFEADMAVVTGNIQALQGQVGSVQGMYDSENYNAAAQEAANLQQQADTVSTDLQGVMEKIKCAPPVPAEPAAE